MEKIDFVNEIRLKVENNPNFFQLELTIIESLNRCKALWLEFDPQNKGEIMLIIRKLVTELRPSWGYREISEGVVRLFGPRS